MNSPLPRIAIKHSTAAKLLGTREPSLKKVRKGWYFHTFSFRVTKSCLQQLAAFPITWHSQQIPCASQQCPFILPAPAWPDFSCNQVSRKRNRMRSYEIWRPELFATEYDTENSQLVILKEQKDYTVSHKLSPCSEKDTSFISMIQISTVIILHLVNMGCRPWRVWQKPERLLHEGRREICTKGKGNHADIFSGYSCHSQATVFFNYQI